MVCVADAALVGAVAGGHVKRRRAERIQLGAQAGLARPAGFRWMLSCSLALGLVAGCAYRACVCELPHAETGPDDERIELDHLPDLRLPVGCEPVAGHASLDRGVDGLEVGLSTRRA